MIERIEVQGRGAYCSVPFVMRGVTYQKQMIYQFQNRPQEVSFHAAITIEESARCKRLRWWATAGVVGLVGAFAFPLVIGLLMESSGGSEVAPDILRILSTISVLSIIPLLVLGSYCLNQAVELSIQEPSVSSPRLLSFDTLRSVKKSHLKDVEVNRERRSRKGRQTNPRNKNHHTLRRIAILLVSFCGALTVAKGQQTVFNVPTTDVLDKGKVYFELDISAKPNDSDALNKFSSFVPRLVVGTGGRVEVGLNITGNVQPGPDSTTLVPAVKWKVYNGGDNGWAMAVGDHLFIPVHNKSYNFGNHTYLMVQKTFKSKTRIGFGAGVFTKDVVAPNAVRGVGQFTCEQPITDKFGVASDWYTGKHASGYWTSGGYYKLTKKLTGYAAYSVGNANPSKGNHYFYFELGYNFN